MARVRKGQLTTLPEGWKHMRWTKRLFWKRERRPAHNEASGQAEFDRQTAGAERIMHRVANIMRELAKR